ncbi:MAG: AbgT family transporter [Phycisphaerales bacterium]
MRSNVGGILALVERVGNRLPDPATLFAIGCAVVLVASAIASGAGWSVAHPTQTGTSVQATNLLSSDGLRWIWLNAVKNFIEFKPLGVVLVAMLGIGVAERSGLFGAILKLLVLATPQRLLTPAVVFAGVMSSAAADAGYVILPPLAAAVFAKAGRAPLAGLAAVTFGIAGGFSANLLLTSLDPLLQGITLQAARLIDPNAVVRVDCNWYFMIASTFMLTLLGWCVNAWMIEPRFSGAVVQAQVARAGYEGAAAEGLDASERRGIVAAAIAAMIVLGVVAASIALPGWPLYGEAEVAPGRVGPVWAEALVPILFVGFLVPGIAYGIAAGTVRSDRDVSRSMTETMAAMGSYLVLAFFAGQFVKWLEKSNLGLMIAVEGIDVLKPLEGSEPVLLPAIVVLVACVNLVMSSASAKWLAIAPVLVPLGMGLGISPELMQATYRVGDSVTNPIAPLNVYLPIVLLAIRRYAPEAGLGTIIALLLPYSIAALLTWTAFLVAWVELGIPLGPG